MALCSYGQNTEYNFCARNSRFESQGMDGWLDDRVYFHIWSSKCLIDCTDRSNEVDAFVVWDEMSHTV